MSISIATNSVDGLLEQKLGVIARAGFDSVVLDQADFVASKKSPQDIAKLVADSDLQIVLFRPRQSVHKTKGFSEEEFLSSTLSLAVSLGAEMVQLDSTTTPTAIADKKRLIAYLTKAAEMAGGCNIRLAYLASPHCDYVNDCLTAYNLVQEVNHPMLGLVINSYFTLADGSKPAQLREIDGERIFHVQLVDSFVLPSEQSSHSSQRNSFSLEYCAMPGLGELNLASFARIIRRSGYSGSWALADTVRQTQQSAESFVRDSYRAIVGLLDSVQQTNQEMQFPIPALPTRQSVSGFEFLEFSLDDNTAPQLRSLLQSLCFRRERRHINKNIELWRQGSINIVLNQSSHDFASESFSRHGPGICDMGMRVEDAHATVARATRLGAPFFTQPVGEDELDIPAIKGVGGSLIHFVDEQSGLYRMWDIDFVPIDAKDYMAPAGLRRIDHIAMTMQGEDVQSWMLFYLSTFDMRKTPAKEIVDPSGITSSQSVESPEGEVRLNLNGARSTHTFSGNFLARHTGAGVQHIAFSTDDMYETSKRLAATGFPALSLPSDYFDGLANRFNLDNKELKWLQKHNVLYAENATGSYYQLYSQPIWGNFFIEIVARRNGYVGYGSSNAPVRLAAQTAFTQLAHTLSA